MTARAEDPPPATLALAASIAVHATARALGVRDATIKWPNDLLVGGAKCAGILLEREGSLVAVGIGLNLAHAPETGRPTTALAAHAPPLPVPEAVLRDHLAPAFADALARWRAPGGLAATCDRWLARAHAIGTRLTVTLPDASALAGTFDGLDPDGAMRLRLAGGSSRAIHAGDVFMIGTD